jgi:hypothetical protein
VLNKRERRIFEARRLADEPITLEDLTEEFAISRERVRQIEARAFEKVRKEVKTAWPQRRSRFHCASAAPPYSKGTRSAMLARPSLPSCLPYLSWTRTTSP